MPRFDEPHDLDPFSSGNIDLQIEGLYRLRRSTHRAIILLGEGVWAETQRLTGRLYTPPAISRLPAPQQPKALAADEATRIARANLYGLDEAATTAAVTLSAQLSDHAPSEPEPGISRLLPAVAVKPPAESGLLRWTSGVGYTSDGIPLIACHWGPLPEGTWLSWWADNRIATQTDVTRHGRTQQEADHFLREVGPLTFGDCAMTLYAGPWPDLPTSDPPPPQVLAEARALATIVLASWALLTAPGAACLVKRRPTATQAAQDRRAGLKPRPVTLATKPVNADIDSILQALDGDTPPPTA